MTEKSSGQDRAKDLAKEVIGAVKEVATERSSRQDKGEGVLDQAKGRIKEAAGVLTGDEELKAAGQADQKKGVAKDKMGKVKDVFK